MRQKAFELYDYREFQDLIDSAIVNAKTSYEMDFVGDLEARFEIYGLETSLTERQVELLEKLAGY